MRPPDTSTSYQVSVCAVFPGPGTTQPWLFLGGQLRLSPAPWLQPGRWGSGLRWEGACPTWPPPLPFCSHPGLAPSLELGPGVGGRVSEDSRSSPSLSPDGHLSQAVLCLGSASSWVPEPALHTDASSSIHDQLGAWGLGPHWGKEASCFLPFPAGQPCSPLSWGVGGWERRGRTLEGWEDPDYRGCPEGLVLWPSGQPSRPWPSWSPLAQIPAY